MQTLQLQSGGIYSVEDCSLTGKRVNSRYSGPGTIIGKRAGVDCRKKAAFVIRLDYGGLFLISRCQFTLL